MESASLLITRLRNGNRTRWIPQWQPELKDPGGYGTTSADCHDEDRHYSFTDSAIRQRDPVLYENGNDTVHLTLQSDDRSSTNRPIALCTQLNHLSAVLFC